MDAFGKLKGRVGQFLEQKKLLSDIAECEAQIAANASEAGPYRRLVELYQLAERNEDAVITLQTLADLSRSQGEHKAAIAFYRQAESMSAQDRRVQILRRIIPLHIDVKEYDEAYAVSREVIEYYLANDQREVAVGFYKTLPQLGERDHLLRRDLSEMVQLRDEVWTQGAKGTWRTQVEARATPQLDDFSGMNVLLVDDDIDLIKLLETTLKPLQCNLSIAMDGEQALERIVERRPSLIISDLVMPKMDGSQLFEELQSDAMTDDIPFMCLTSHGDASEQTAAFERGVEYFVTKPFRPKEMRLLVARILRRVRKKSALSGNLEELTIANILRLLESTRRTGALVLEGRGRSAAIYIVDGHAVDAVFGDRGGEEAFYAVVPWREGRFRFSRRPVACAQRIFTGSQELLAEAQRRHTEERRLVAALPHDPNAVLVLTARLSAAELPRGATMADFERIQRLLDGTYTVPEIVAALAGLPDPLRLLVELYVRGLVRRIEPEVRIMAPGEGGGGESTSAGRTPITSRVPDTDLWK